MTPHQSSQRSPPVRIQSCPNPRRKISRWKRLPPFLAVKSPSLRLRGNHRALPCLQGSSSKSTSQQRSKDSEGRYIVTKKVKVDRVEHLSEVPKRWPVPPEDATVAYVIDLNEDKKWQEGTSKNIAFDRFLKQEVNCNVLFTSSPNSINLSNFV